MKVTLVYPDRPSPQLQNNLTLRVLGSDGTVEASVTPNNNVEQIWWENVPPGVTRIMVTADDITLPDDRQSFAVVWRIIPMGVGN